MINAFVSIILPVLNEANYIENCLCAIFNQDYPIDCMEIIIADGMSTDSTREIIGRISNLNPGITLNIIDNPRKLVSYGLNKATLLAKGEIIIRVDGHCVIAPNYVSLCVKYLQTENLDGVGGPMLTIGETNLSLTIALAMSSPFGVGNSAFRTSQDKTIISDTVPFPAYTRKIIDSIGLYDEELVRNQDDEYNYRLREAGGRLLLAADIKSKYYSRGTLSGLWLQYFQYGFWKVPVMQKHPKQMSLRQFVPPLFVFGLISSSMLLFFPNIDYLAFALPVLYLFANFFASILTAQKNGWQHLLFLPIVFAILHISYGLGFLVGLFKFWNRFGNQKAKEQDLIGYPNQTETPT